MKNGPTPKVTGQVLAGLLLVFGLPGALAQIKAIDEDIQVVVKEGDSLTAIVKTVMGSAGFWEEVAELNMLQRPNALRPGQVINFPKELVQERNFARIVFAKGQSTLNRFVDDAEVPAEKGLQVYLGDVIETGRDGFVSLSFAGASLVNIQPDSRVQIVEFDCFDSEKPCIVNLVSELGQLNFDVRNVGFSKPPRYTVETPHLTAAVRGTGFDVDTTETSTLGVTEGSVRASSGNFSAVIPTGKAAVAGEGRSVTTLIDLLPNPEYNRYIRLSAEDYISWTPVENALRYKYVFAENESLSDVIISRNAVEAYVPLLSEAGQFYIGTRAVDENGIKGFRAIQRVEQVSIAAEIQAPELDIELSDNELKIVNTGNLTAEIHIGDQLELSGDLSELIQYDAYDLEAGETLEVTVGNDSDIYISARALVSSTVVSPYGSLYEFKRSSNQTQDR